MHYQSSQPRYYYDWQTSATPVSEKGEQPDGTSRTLKTSSGASAQSSFLLFQSFDAVRSPSLPPQVFCATVACHCLHTTGLVEPTEGQLRIKNLREHMQLEIRKLHRDMGATFIYGMKWMRNMVKIANGGRPVLPAGA